MQAVTFANKHGSYYGRRDNDLPFKINLHMIDIHFLYDTMII